MSVVEAPVLQLPKVTDNGDPFYSKEQIDKLNIWYEEGVGYHVWGGSDYIGMNEGALKQYLKTRAISTKAKSHASQMDHVLTDVRMGKNVKYVGALAGKSSGIHSENGQRMLITGKPTLIQPDAAVDWSLLREFLEELLEPGGGVQLAYFYSWLKVGLRAIEEAKLAPGQVLALAGPAACGKSLLQTTIGQVLGGRVANPFAFISGATPFNRELFRCETLIMGDEISSPDIRVRRNVGAKLKQMTVNQDQNCHGKGREGLTLRPQWRISISLNDEKENLSVLPPMDESIRDKIMLFRVERPKLFDNLDLWSNDRCKDWERLRAGLPGMVAFLHQWEIPQGLRCGRFGVKAYQDPDLMTDLEELSPEARLLDLIDMSELLTSCCGPVTVNCTGETKERSPRESWDGSALDLEQYLCSDVQKKHIADSVKRLMTHNSAIANYLGRLAKKHPDRVEAIKARDRTIWRLFPQA